MLSRLPRHLGIHGVHTRTAVAYRHGKMTLHSHAIKRRRVLVAFGALSVLISFGVVLWWNAGQVQSEHLTAYNDSLSNIGGQVPKDIGRLVAAADRNDEQM